MPNKLILGNSSGLCNRLRLLSSWYAVSTKPIEFRWPTNTACPTPWDHLFEPLPGITFVYTDKIPTRYRRKLLHHTSFTILDLKTKFNIEFIDDTYLAVHVRRTDIGAVQKKYGIKPLSDQEYFNQIESKEFDKIYLATDNSTTQQTFINRYGSRLIYQETIKHKGSRFKPYRCSPIQHAVKDLVICSKANEFIGTRCSSFSGEIILARNKYNARANNQSDS